MLIVAAKDTQIQFPLSHHRQFAVAAIVLPRNGAGTVIGRDAVAAHQKNYGSFRVSVDPLQKLLVIRTFRQIIQTDTLRIGTLVNHDAGRRAFHK